MSQSTNGILAYGYDLGGQEEWKVREWDDDSYTLNVPWIDNDAEEVTDWLAAFQERLVEAWNDEHGTTYDPASWSAQEDVLKLLGVELETYCSDGYPMYVLAAATLTAYRGDAKDAGPLLTADSATVAGWDAKLATALAALGLTPLQEKPAWLLCSYVDGF